jgi:hypothetical protein
MQAGGGLRKKQGAESREQKARSRNITCPLMISPYSNKTTIMILSGQGLSSRAFKK